MGRRKKESGGGLEGGSIVVWHAGVGFDLRDDTSSYIY